ncbi:uncharacterized protein VNE69_04039 [Vairimorpha necatrix]|uniref:Uncharacterized protein n=1 Tax=Vairimorpha necatrix TaxID=6039 RepID=A0AAX4JB61_9MICR
METIKFFYTFLIVQGFQNTYNQLYINTLKKIENKEYLVIDTEKQYMRIRLCFDYFENEFYFNKEFEGFGPECIFKKTINEEKESVTLAIEEFEEKMLHECNTYLPDYIILLYSKMDYEINPTYKLIINQIKNLNGPRTQTSIRNTIHYDHIVEESIHYAIMFSKIKKHSIKKLGDLETLDSAPMFIKKNNNVFICFFINLEHIYYFFEIDIRELNLKNIFNSANFRTSHKNKTDKQISNLFRHIYKYAYMDKIRTSSFIFLLRERIDDIELNNGGLKIRINKSDVNFIQDSICYTYYSRNMGYILKSDVRITTKCFTEFEMLFDKIFSINDNNELISGVDMFYRLIESDNKVEFLLQRILNNCGTAINIMFAHLVFSEKLIDENELNEIIMQSNSEITEHAKLINSILKSLSNHRILSSTFLMKICLFLEAEQYLNENKMDNDSIFGTLKKIGQLITSKKDCKRTKDPGVTSKNEFIDLSKIYHEAIKYHMQDIIDFHKKVDEFIIKITFLVTGYETCFFKQGRLCFELKKDEIINFFKFDIDQVEKNNDLISKKLSINMKEDLNNAITKYYDELKNIIRPIDEENITTDLNNIKIIFIKIIRLELCSKLFKLKKEALINEVDNLYDEDVRNKFEEELKKNGNEEIDRCIQYENLTKNIKNLPKYIDEIFINECKTELKNKFYEDISKNLEQNVIHSRKKYFTQTLMALFKKFIKNGESDIELSKNILFKIKEKLNEKEILAEVNDRTGMEIHENLVKALENNEISK